MDGKLEFAYSLGPVKTVRTVWEAFGQSESTGSLKTNCWRRTNSEIEESLHNEFSFWIRIHEKRL